MWSSTDRLSKNSVKGLNLLDYKFDISLIFKRFLQDLCNDIVSIK